MLTVKIVNKQDEEKFIQKGSSVIAVYNAEWQEGDKIKILLDGTIF